MSLYITQIKKKIKNKIQLEEIEIIDNSDAHKSHKSFQKGKLKLRIIEVTNMLFQRFTLMKKKRK